MTHSALEAGPKSKLPVLGFRVAKVVVVVDAFQVWSSSLYLQWGPCFGSVRAKRGCF